MIVKVCGITNLEDALAAVESGADALGFNFYRKSPRYVAPESVGRIVEQLPPSVMCVGVFVNEGGPEQVSRVAATAGLKAVQLHGDESPEYVSELRDLFVIKALRVTEDFEPEGVMRFGTDAILLDAFAAGARGGTGKAFDWSVARRVRALVPRLFLAGGLSLENVAEAINVVRPYAVDACSSIESAPGKKDAAKMRSFLNAARAAG